MSNKSSTLPSCWLIAVARYSPLMPISSRPPSLESSALPQLACLLCDALFRVDETCSGAPLLSHGLPNARVYVLRYLILVNEKLLLVAYGITEGHARADKPRRHVDDIAWALVTLDSPASAEAFMPNSSSSSAYMSSKKLKAAPG